MAFHQHTDIESCQDANSSTEFLKWNKFLDGEEYDRNKKADYALARISWEVRSFMRMFGDKREMPDLEDFIPKFQGSEAAPKAKEEPPRPILEGDFETGGGRPGIEIGEELDHKWKVVAANAKADWSRLAGVSVSGGG